MQNKTNHSGGIIVAALLSGFVLSLFSCGTPRNVRTLQELHPMASLTLPEHETSLAEYEIRERVDSFVVQDFQGNDVIIMDAIRDESTGEMVANETIKAAHIEARFRNVAERHGRVDIEFQVIVPQELFDTKWQIRFYPRMEILGDTLDLEDIYITGADYRREQDRGYARYARFLQSIVTDSTRFIDMHQLDVYIERHLPKLWSLKQDTTWYSNEQFESIYGVTEAEAADYYTYGILVRRNERKIRDKDKMYRRYVRAPYVQEGVRLDTLMRNMDGDFVYNYIQTINTQPRLRKVDVLLAGEIFEQDKHIYDVPPSDPLTFYISSLSSFVDGTERYLDRVISRTVEANTSCRIDFQLGRADLVDTLRNNRAEIDRIKGVLSRLVESDEFVMDSIVVAATASPEGSWATNRRLSERRGEAVSKYFGSWLRRQADSISHVAATVYSLGEEFKTEDQEKLDRIAAIGVVSRANPENWEGLDRLVREDVVLNDGEKEEYWSHAGARDFDLREQQMRRDSRYKYYKDVLYPQLRTVDFSFHMHRRDMVQDTVHTTILDTTYMDGVQAIRDRDYERAAVLLRPYGDYNLAVAYSCLDRNASALQILESLQGDGRTPQVEYMLAVLYARRGDDRRAVEAYISSCHRNPSYVHRGNLDPEISALIRAYNLNDILQKDDQDMY